MKKDCNNCKHSDGMFCNLKAERVLGRPDDVFIEDIDTSDICPDGKPTHWEPKESIEPVSIKGTVRK